MLLWSGAFYVVTAISVVFLYWAYGIPILLNLRNRWRGKGEFTTRGVRALEPGAVDRAPERDLRWCGSS